MRILHIVLSFDVSGRSRIVHALSRGLAALGAECSIAVLGGEGGYVQQDVACHVLGKKDGFDWGVARALRRLLKEQRPDIIQTHGRGALMYAVLARPRRRMRIVHTVHRADGDLVHARRLFRRLLLQRVDRLVAVSDAARAAFADANRYPASRVQVILNGVDMAAFRVRPRERAAASPFTLGAVANLTADKDHATILRALAIVRESDPAARLIVAGEGAGAAAVHRQVEELRLGGAVDFRGFCADIPALLGELDVFVQSSKTEGLGLAVIEAMAAGVAVVASRTGGIPEIVKDGENGLLVRAGDARALADAILRLRADADLRRRLAVAGQASVQGRFALERMCRDYAALYATLVNGGGR